MAKLHQGILGAFSGKVGTLVGYTWRGLACVRAYRREVAYPNTPMQQAERDWFVGMVRFAAKAGGALRLGLREAAGGRSMTECNYFVMSNKRHFVQHEGTVSIDYAGLRLAQGAAAEVGFKAPRFEEGEVLCVDYEKNTGLLNASPEDRVYVYAYAPGVGEGYLSAPSLRRGKTLKMRLPEHWAGAEVHLYGFVVDRVGRASNSAYIGSGIVSQPMPAGDPCALEESDSMNLDEKKDTPAAIHSPVVGGVDAASLRSAADPPAEP